MSNKHILRKLADGLKNLQFAGLSADYKKAELTFAVGDRTITFNKDGEIVGESN